MSGRQSSAARGSLSRQGGGERFVARRRLRRRRVLIALVVIFLLFSAGFVYELRQSALRISHIQVFGLSAPARPAGGGEAVAEQSVTDIASRAMQGDYFWLIPRDSTVFFPAERIRADIVAAHPDIAAVSIFRNGLTGLSIKANAHVPIARWCGVSSGATAVASSTANCYFFDASGFMYATASDAQPVNAFIVYAPLTGGGETIGSTLANADKLPAAFDFARQVGTLGSPVSAVVFRDDEVDEFLESGTRITYVLGNEQNAYTALVSARGYLNLADGSLEYVDLRFAGETYFKRKK